MTNRPQGLEAFSDAKVQALFEQFFPAAEVHAEIGDRLTQRVLAEVHTIYGQGAERSSLRGLLERWHTWWIQFNQRPLLIAFGAVACVAMALLTVSTLLPSQSTSPLSLVAMVPSGEAIVLAARGDTYYTYRTGEQFSLRANDQVIVRAGAVELEPFPQQITEILPGSQIALSTVTHVDGKPILELNVIDGQVRHRSFGQQLVNGTYIISTGDIRAFAQNNDIQVDALSPARTLVTAFTDSAWVETQGSMYEVKAGRSAEFGGRVMIIRDITPVEEGPGQIALAPTPTQTTFSATPIAPSPIPHDEIVIASTPSPVDSGDQSTGVALGALEAVAVADAGPVLTVGDVAVQESGALVTLLVNGTGAPGSAVQVLIENTPLVTTTVTAAGTWSATAPLLEPGYFAVNVAALDNTGTALMTVAAAELQVLPPATPGIPPTPTQPLVNTQTPPTASATPAAATATPIPLRATQTPTPISFFVAPPTPTATATRPVAASATPTATGTRLVVIAPTSTTTPTPMQTATPTLTATPIATMTTSPTATASATAIATWTPSPTVTATDTPLWPTLTPTRTPTTTPIPSDTPTSTWTPSPTVTATDTPLWPTLTPTRTPSATPTLTTVPTSTSAPTATGTNTPVWPTPTSTATSTPTPIPPIPTTAPTATAANVIVEITPTALPPANNDGEPTAAATNTPMAAPTATPTAAATNTPMAAPTATPTAAPTNTPMAAPTATPTAAPTNTPMAAPTATPTAAPTNTPMAAPTAAPVSLEPTPTVAPTEPSIVATTPEGSAALPDAATETPTP